MATEVLGPIVAFDQVITAGAQSPPVIGPTFKLGGGGGNLPAYQSMHAGFGADGAGTIDISVDGVNWVTAVTLVLTATTPGTNTSSSIGLVAASVIYVRVTVTHGGANGGRLTILLNGPRGEE